MSASICTEVPVSFTEMSEEIRTLERVSVAENVNAKGLNDLQFTYVIKNSGSNHWERASLETYLICFSGQKRCGSIQTAVQSLSAYGGMRSKVLKKRICRHGNWPRIRGVALEKKMSTPKNKMVRSNLNVMVLHQVKNWQNWKMQGCFMQFLRLIFVKKLQAPAFQLTFPFLIPMRDLW